MLTTIQISKQEDRLITRLKNLLNFSSKKAVVMAGIQNLLDEYEKKLKAEKLKKMALKVQKESARVNREFSGLAYGLKHDDSD